MQLELKAPKITKIVLALPKNTRTYEQDMSHINSERLKSIKKRIGINKRYISDENTFASDLCIAALDEALKLSGKEIDALIVSSWTPDYLTPKLSNIIAHKIGLNSKVLCIDLFGCCNILVTAFAQAAMLLEHCSRVAVVCVDIATKAIDPNEKQHIATISDSASATIMETSNERMYFTEEIYLEKIMDMSNSCSCMKKEDSFLKINNELIFKTFFEHFPKLYKNFITQTPKIDINIIHAANKFFQDMVEKELNIKFFNKSLERFACLYVNDLPMNLLLANDEIKFRGNRALLVGHGTGMTISMINLPIYNFQSKIIFI